MDRRAFLKLSVLSGLVLAVPGIAAHKVQAASSRETAGRLGLDSGQIVLPDGRPAANFGPDLPVTSLYQEDGVWYAQVGPENRQFWLKSYNHGRAWASLSWQPRPNSAALKS